MLSLSNVSVRRDDWVLKNVSFEFRAGTVYGIVGKSGAGKTTLLKVMSGLLDVSEGEVRFLGQTLQGPSVKLIPGYDDIQLVNQDFALEPYHTVAENIKEKILSRHSDDQNELISDFLDLVELKDLKDRKGNELSGGEQQRLAIARALACEPKVLLLDEPFVHLDQRLRWKILKYLNELRQSQNMLIVLVSHDGAEMMGFTQEIVYLNESKFARVGLTIDLYNNPLSKDEAELLGQINEIKVDGESYLFRPSNYEVVLEGGVEVRFVNSVNTGLCYLNYFETKFMDSIVLVNQYEMNDVNRIRVKK